MNTLCPPKSKLQSLSHGLLSEEESGELLRHLDGCDSCQHAIESVDSAKDSLIYQIRIGEDGATHTFENEADCKIAGMKALAALGANANELHGSHFELPKQIGDYEIVRPLGRGGMGQVYLGRHSRLERLVAIKCIARHRQFDETAHQRFSAEMKHVGSLSHPNIVQAFDAREADGMAVLVTEFIDGLNVNQIVKRQPAMSTGDACKIAMEVCEALGYVDSMNMIHRDVKPSNIMIDKQGQVKLLDLGLARLQSNDGGHELTATGQALGTVDYVAPEQINGSKDIDFRADIYSLGCTLYKLLTGRAPFDSVNYPTALAKLNAHVNEQPAPAVGAVELPGKLQKLLSQMLHKDPNKRPQSYDDIKNVLKSYATPHDLKQVVATALQTADAEPAQNVAAQKTGSSTGRRWPWLVGFAASLAAILLATLGIILTVQKPNGELAQVTIPDGATAVIDDEGNISVRLSDGKSARIEKANVTRGVVPAGSSQFEFISSDPALAGAEAGDLTDLWQEPSWSKETGLIRRSLIAGQKKIVAIRPEKSDGEKTGGSIVTVTLNEQEREALASAKDRNLEPSLTAFSKDNHTLHGQAKLEGVYRVTSVVTKDSLKPEEDGLEGALIIFRNDEMLSVWQGEISLCEITYYSGTELTFGVGQGYILGPSGLREHGNGTTARSHTIGAFEFGESGKVKLKFVEQKFDEAGKLAEIDAPGELRLERLGSLDATIPKTFYPHTMAMVSGLLELKSKLNQLNISVHTAVEKGEGEIPADVEEVEVAVFQEQKRKIWIHKEPYLNNDSIASAQLDDFFGGCMSLKLTPAGGERYWAEISRLQGNILLVTKVDGKIVAAHLSGRDEFESHWSETVCTVGMGVQDAQLEQWVEKINQSRQLTAMSKRVFAMRAKKDNSRINAASLALLNYEAANLSLPASKNVTQNGSKKTKPYSWRVALLPFLDRNDLYKQYRFDEQWDSEHNQKLLAQMPDAYRHPSAPKDSTTTWIVGFADDDSSLGINKGTTFAKIADGTSNTLLLVETDSGIPWTKPEDLPFTDEGMARAMDATKSPQKEKGIWISRVDGSNYFLTPEKAKENLRKLITRDGGERIEE